MTFNEIKQNILRWNDIRTDSTLIKPLFAEDFHFVLPASTQTFPHIPRMHFYPAITTDDIIVMYVIQSRYDKFTVFEQDPSSYTDYIMIAEKKLGNAINDFKSRIGEDEAIKRIGNWNLHHDQWIDDKAPNGGLFQAFTLKASDIDFKEEFKLSFGLVGNAVPFDFKVDMVLNNEQENTYYNTVRPVPPFGNDGEKTFFILNAATTPGISENIDLKKQMA